MKKTIFCIIGQTASGKDTLVSRLCEETGLTKLISYTTRAPRHPNEDTHIFATREDFIQHQAENNIAAHTEIGEHLYWSTKTQLLESDVYVIDPNGLQQLKWNVDNVRIVTIYIMASYEDRKKRFLLREKDAIDKFITRTEAEKQQFEVFEYTHDWDYAVVNEHFGDALRLLKAIIKAERDYIYEI